MKLFLSLTVMILALAGLIVVLKPPNKSKKKSQPRLKAKPRPATGKTQPALKAKQSPAPQAAVQKSQAGESEGEHSGEPSMEEIRQAVRRYVNKFPGVTADIMGDWMKKR